MKGSLETIWRGVLRTNSTTRIYLCFWFVLQFGFQTYYDGWHHLLDIIVALLIGTGLGRVAGLSPTVEQFEQKAKRLELEYAESQRRMLQLPLCCPRCSVEIVAPGRADH